MHPIAQDVRPFKSVDRKRCDNLIIVKHGQLGYLLCHKIRNPVWLSPVVFRTARDDLM
jgi:hypothetical protein